MGDHLQAANALTPLADGAQSASARGMQCERVSVCVCLCVYVCVCVRVCGSSNCSRHSVCLAGRQAASLCSGDGSRELSSPLRD